ncbi:hypothetical protein D3C84_886990 [compost metagenome]
MHTPLRDEFTVEVSEFFQQPDVLQERRTAWPGGLDIEVIGYRCAGGVGQLFHEWILNGLRLIRSENRR